MNNKICSKKIIDVGYEVSRLARDLDWVAVMTYDYHGHWDKKTGHVAPFYGHPDDDFYYFNTVSLDFGSMYLSRIYMSTYLPMINGQICRPRLCIINYLLLQNYTINYWIELGAPRSKLVLGMPLYGQSFTLDSAAQHGLNAAARAKGAAGEFTRAPGFLAYYEICQRVNTEGWTVVRDR